MATQQLLTSVLVASVLGGQAQATTDEDPGSRSAAGDQQSGSRRGVSQASPDPAVAQLLFTIEALQQQQERAEAARLAAEEEARKATEEIAQQERQLHQALRLTASLEDRVETAQLVLDARLQEKATKTQLLRAQQQALEGLRSTAEGLAQLCSEKEIIVQQLRNTLLGAGMSQASLAQLEAEALRAPAASSPSPAPQTEAARPSWFGGGGGGLFASLKSGKWEGGFRRKSQA